jgi:hypothetical protein
VRQGHTRFGEKSEIEPAMPARKKTCASLRATPAPYFFFFLAVFFFVAFFAVFFFAALAMLSSLQWFRDCGQELDRADSASDGRRFGVRSMPLPQVRPRSLRARDNDSDDANNFSFSSCQPFAVVRTLVN